MLYRLPNFINKVEYILEKLKMGNQKEKRYSAYLLQRLFYFYIRLAAVIQSGENLNRSLTAFINAFSEGVLRNYHCDELWRQINSYRGHTYTASDEILHIDAFVDHLIASFTEDYPSEDFWRTTVKISRGEDIYYLAFSVDNLTVGDIEHDEDPELRKPKIRFDYKIGDSDKIELVEFEFPIPNPDNQSPYFFDESIDLESLHKETIRSSVAKFTARDTLSTMKLCHKQIKLMLTKHWGASMYLDVLDLEKNHLPNVFTNPDW